PLVDVISADGTCDTLTDRPADLLTDHGSAVMPQLGTSIAGSYFLPTQTGYRRSEAVSTDRGRSWRPVVVPDGLQILRVIGARSTTTYAEAFDAATDSVTLLASRDGGLGWTAVPGAGAASAARATAAMLTDETPLLATGGHLAGAAGSAPRLPA